MQLSETFKITILSIWKSGANVKYNHRTRCINNCTSITYTVYILLDLQRYSASATIRHTRISLLNQADTVFSTGTFTVGRS